MPYPGATGYNVYRAPELDPDNYVLTEANISVSVLEMDCEYVKVTAITPNGETSLTCDPLHFCVPDVPCVNYFLTDITDSTANVTWDPYTGATGYNVYRAPEDAPAAFVLTETNIPLSVVSIDCEYVIVTAIAPLGETPQCTPVHYCFVDTPVPEGIDMPMNQAVYSPSLDKIYAVKDQWLYECNADTGVVERVMRWFNNTLKETSICELNGKIYLTVMTLEHYNMATDSDLSEVDIYVVDPVIWPTVTALGLGPVYMSSVGSDGLGMDGWRQLATDGTLLFTTNYNQGLCKFDPTNPLATFDTASSYWPTDICYDSVNVAIWTSSNYDGSVNITDPDFGSYNTAHDVPPYYQLSTGITIDTARNKAYTVDGSAALREYNSETLHGVDWPPYWSNVTFQSYSMGFSGAENPRRVKYCGTADHPFEGKLLIPTWSGDTVLVWDTATNTATETISGFINPVDVVFTPTKAFAVQNSPVGLLEIVSV